MSNVLSEFLVAIGYQVDADSERQALASEKRVEQALVGGDKRITDAQTTGSAKRLIVANREQGVRTRGAALILAESRKMVVADDVRLKAEVRAAEIREKLHVGATRFAQGLTTTVQGVTAAIVGSSVAVASVAVSSTLFFEKMAVGLERLYYSSQRTKSSAASLQAFGYAAGQMGSSVEEAIGTVEELAQKMRASPGYEAMFKGLGVNTRDAKGNLRETTDILMDLGDAFKAMPIHQQKAYADALGIPERMLMTLTSGDFRKNIDKYQKMLGMAGLRPDEAAKKSKAFMDIWRDMGSAIGITATKVEGALIDKFGGALERFTNWLLTNSGAISDKIIRIGEVIGGWVEKLFRLFDAFQRLNPATQDALLKIAALVAAFIAFNSGPIGALLALTAALVAFLDEETLKKLGEMWERFDALTKKLVGQDGLTVAMEVLGAALALKVLAPLLKIVPLLTSLVGMSLPAWLLTLLGVGAAAHAANSIAKGGLPAGVDPITGSGPGEEVGSGLIQPGQEGKYGAKADDKRNLWQRVMPKILGGKDSANGATASAGNLTKLIDAEAKRAGIDPRTMQGIRAGESGRGSAYDKKDDAIESSWGPFQLNRRGGLGAEFEKQTGLDVRDPSTIPQQTRWVAEYIAKQRAKNPNWNVASKWHGYRGDRDADPSWGDAGYTPDPPAAGAPSGVTDISNLANFRGGKLDAVKGFVMHHTGGRGTPEGVVNTLNQRGLSVQYVMDRQGNVFQTLPDGARGAHILPAQNGSGLNNSNTLGMEVIANDDRDINPTQVAAARAFLNQMSERYPGLKVFGHGELNAHKQETEGRTIVDAFRKGGGPALTVPPGMIPGLERGLNAMRTNGNAWEANPFKSAPLGGWTNTSTSTTNNISTGPVTNNVSGVGDAKQAAEVIGQKTSRVHADLLRNVQGAVA